VAPPIPVSVRVRLEELSKVCGGRAAYLDAGGETVCWEAIARQAADWAIFFPPGTMVALQIAGPAAFCRAYLAGLAAGVCLAPIDPRASAAEAAALLDLTEAADIVTDEASAAKLDGVSASVWITSAAGLRQARQGHDVRLAAPGVAAVLPTSGTTGKPKLVPLTQPQLLRVATLVAGHHALTPAERGYCPLPLFHVNAQVVGVLSTLVAGASLVLDDRFHASTFWQAAEEFEVTWLNLVPAILAILGQSAPPADAVSQRVRFARSASAPLPAAVHNRFEARSGVGVLETYGMTEAASQIAASPLTVADRQPGSVGLPVGLGLRVVADSTDLSGHAGPSGRRELPPRETGAVEIRGRNVINAYLGRGRSTIPARSADGWLRTGDLASRDAEGFLYLAGRSDDVINRGGEKFHPREIEEVLLADPRVRSAVVVGRPHPLLGEEPIAYVVAAPARTTGSQTDTSVCDSPAGAELLAACQRALSPHKRPADIVLVDALPAGPTGKLNRRALRAGATPHSVR
jgi:acyl-CoA synthetase (AMP-forming)/AMP-acid ligase II